MTALFLMLATLLSLAGQDAYGVDPRWAELSSAGDLEQAWPRLAPSFLAALGLSPPYALAGEIRIEEGAVLTRLHHPAWPARGLPLQISSDLRSVRCRGVSLTDDARDGRGSGTSLAIVAEELTRAAARLRATSLRLDAACVVAGHPFDDTADFLERRVGLLLKVSWAQGDGRGECSLHVRVGPWIEGPADEVDPRRLGMYVDLEEAIRALMRSRAALEMPHVRVARLELHGLRRGRASCRLGPSAGADLLQFGFGGCYEPGPWQEAVWIQAGERTLRADAWRRVLIVVAERLARDDARLFACGAFRDESTSESVLVFMFRTSAKDWIGEVRLGDTRGPFWRWESVVRRRGSGGGTWFTTAGGLDLTVDPPRTEGFCGSYRPGRMGWRGRTSALLGGEVLGR